MRPMARPRRKRPSSMHWSERRDVRARGQPNRSTPPAIDVIPRELGVEAPAALPLRRLATLVARNAPRDGAFPLCLPGTYVVRRSYITSEAAYSTMRPALCIVAQGAKDVMMGRD